MRRIPFAQLIFWSMYVYVIILFASPRPIPPPNNEEPEQAVVFVPPPTTTSTESIDINDEVVSKDWVKRRVTAYNAGDPAQTDDTPCIGAAGEDICELLDMGFSVCAANFVPLGTFLEIKDLPLPDKTQYIHECIVLDRMNIRYPDAVDIALPLGAKSMAREFGVRYLEVRPQ